MSAAHDQRPPRGQHDQQHLESQSDPGYCAICSSEWSPEARPHYCQGCGFPTNPNGPDGAPASEHDALDRYAEEHTGDTGHAPNAPRPHLAQFIWDTLSGANRELAAQLRRERGQS